MVLFSVLVVSDQSAVPDMSSSEKNCIGQFAIGLYTVAKNRSTRKASWEDTYTSYEAYT